MNPGDERDVRHEFFYRDGTPETARALLLKFLGEELPDISAAIEAGEREQQLAAVARLRRRTLFFVRAAEKRPELRRVYEEVARAATRPQLAVLLPVLAHVGDEATAATLVALSEAHGLGPARSGKDPQLERLARAPISEAGHIELRWAEFAANGDIAKVIEILGVLGGPDRFRAHLEGLLRPASRIATSFSALEERRRQLVSNLRPFGLRFAASNDAILNPEDLDLVVVDGVRLVEERFAGLDAALPAPLPEALTAHMRLKAHALTSLASRAIDHSLVLGLCDAAAGKLTGAVRLTLLTLLVEVHAVRGELPAARAAMRRLLEGNRVREDLRVRAAALLPSEPSEAKPK